MTTPTAKDVADVIGRVGYLVGKTRLQKTVALLELTGLGSGFSFSYHLYGPYSEELSAAVERGVLLGLIEEKEQQANWGGRYSVFTSHSRTVDISPKQTLIELCNDANAVALELAVTAAFVAEGGEDDAWLRVSELKPEKAKPENVRKAKELYRKFLDVQVPRKLPAIV
ncbi:MAG TPA: hypothetical protein VG735_07190 [Caulobacterales bacterium]|nr:hypothetical protein [Caulobacterales bacterium]